MGPEQDRDEHCAVPRNRAERQARGEDVTVLEDEGIELETFNPDDEGGSDDDGDGMQDLPEPGTEEQPQT